VIECSAERISQLWAILSSSNPSVRFIVCIRYTFRGVLRPDGQIPKGARELPAEPATKSEVQPRRLRSIIAAVSGRLRQFIRWLGSCCQAGFVSSLNPSIDLRILREQVAVRPLDDFDFIAEPNGDLVNRGASTGAI
jgi:hypothetical protein